MFENTMCINIIIQFVHEVLDGNINTFFEKYKMPLLHFSVCFISLNTGSLIVEKKPRHFKIDGTELSNRREFISRTRASVKVRRIL